MMSTKELADHECGLYRNDDIIQHRMLASDPRPFRTLSNAVGLLSDRFENLQNGLSQQRNVELDHALLLIEDVRADDAH
jgi:hypothetical protein